MTNFTKRMLAESLKQLMLKKPLQKITVKELVATCGVNRQTFYYHFHDIYALLSWIYRSEAVAAISNISFSSWQEEIAFIIDYLDNNRTFCSNTYRSLGKDYLERFLTDVFDTMLDQVLDSTEGADKLSAIDRQFIIRLYGYALSGVAQDWIGAGFKPAAEILSNQICTSMEGTLVQMVNKFIPSTK